MSARVSADAPKLATVAVSGQTVACMAASGNQLLFRADSVAHAAYQASIVRELLADAYLAGKAAGAEAGACGHPVGYVDLLTGDCTVCAVTP